MTRKEEKRLKAEYNRRLNELNDIRLQLRRAYAAFDNTTDCDMMDACIYEICKNRMDIISEAVSSSDVSADVVNSQISADLLQEEIAAVEGIY